MISKVGRIPPNHVQSCTFFLKLPSPSFSRLYMVFSFPKPEGQWRRRQRFRCGCPGFLFFPMVLTVSAHPEGWFNVFTTRIFIGFQKNFGVWNHHKTTSPKMNMFAEKGPTWKGKDCVPVPSFFCRGRAVIPLRSCFAGGGAMILECERCVFCWKLSLSPWPQPNCSVLFTF